VPLRPGGPLASAPLSALTASLSSTVPLLCSCFFFDSGRLLRTRSAMNWPQALKPPSVRSHLLYSYSSYSTSSGFLDRLLEFQTHLRRPNYVLVSEYPVVL
jgi:hypothetical protein